jgi:hypothetical protein
VRPGTKGGEDKKKGGEKNQSGKIVGRGLYRINMPHPYKAFN